MKAAMEAEWVRTRQDMAMQEERKRQNKEVFKLTPYTCMLDRLETDDENLSCRRQELMQQQQQPGGKKKTNATIADFFDEMKTEAIVQRVTIDDDRTTEEALDDRLSQRREKRNLRQEALEQLRSAKLSQFKQEKRRQRNYYDENDVVEKAVRVAVDRDQELPYEQHRYSAAAIIGTPNDWTVPPTTSSLTSAFAEWVENEADITAYIPPPNSPPAALRHYGTMQTAPTPPFGSSSTRS